LSAKSDYKTGCWIASIPEWQAPADLDESKAQEDAAAPRHLTNRLLFGFSLHTDRVPFELVDSTARHSSPMKGERRWRGPYSISKFDHHNISGGAVDNT
jgi:hypothetical protein